MKQEYLENKEIPFETLLSHVSHIVAAGGVCEGMEISRVDNSGKSFVEYFLIDRFALVPVGEVFDAKDPSYAAQNYLCKSLGEGYSCNQESGKISVRRLPRD